MPQTETNLCYTCDVSNGHIRRRIQRADSFWLSAYTIRISPPLWTKKIKFFQHSKRSTCRRHDLYRVVSAETCQSTFLAVWSKTWQHLVNICEKCHTQGVTYGTDAVYQRKINTGICDFRLKSPFISETVRDRPIVAKEC